MDVNVIMQLIGSLGFPIVCCGYMMVKNDKTLERLTDVIGNNTKVLTRVLEHMGLDDEGDEQA